MEVNTNFAWRKEKNRNNSVLLPDSIRGLIVGKGNCGKTTLLLNLLLNPGWLDYDHLFVFGKSLHQREYVILKKGLEAELSKDQVANLFHNQKDISSPTELIDDYIKDGGVRKGGIHAEFYDNCTLIPDPSSLNEQVKNLMIFDDCILENQNKAQSYYTRGRHSNCDCFYISQNYFKLDRQTIRENSNLIILFSQSGKNISHIYEDHCTDISLDTFKSFCNKVWADKYNFVCIDLTRSKDNGKYRKNFDKSLNPIDMSFFDLDRNTRDKLVEEYTNTINKIQQRNENEKTTNLKKQSEFSKTFAPIIQATEEQTKQLKGELQNLAPDNWNGIDALDYYFNHYKGDIDTLFGIRIEGGKYMMGDKEVDIVNNNVYVDGHEYLGTTALWALIMEKVPDMRQVQSEQLQKYKELVGETDVLEYALNNHKNAKRFGKYKIITQEGSGISFLPSDIGSLQEKLNLLLGEFNAGNRATRNEIVAIVDNLISRKKIKREEVKDINNYLKNVDN